MIDRNKTKSALECGFKVEDFKFEETASEEEVLQCIEDLNADKSFHGTMYVCGDMGGNYGFMRIRASMVWCSRFIDIRLAMIQASAISRLAELT